MKTLTDYRQAPHWSYSSLNQFFNICSLQYYFDRILKLPRTFTPLSLAFGSAYHRVMEHVALIRIEGKTPSVTDAADLFQTAFERQVEDEPDIDFGDKVDAESCAAQGRSMCACYVEHIDPEEQVIAISEAFQVPLTDATGFTLDTPLIGEIDSVVQKNKTLSLVDWKTAARRWPITKADKEWQPIAFLLGYSQKYGTHELPEFKYEVCTKTATPAYAEYVTTRSEDDFHRLASFARLAESMIAAEHFIPNEQGFYCGSCPHATACKAWHRDPARGRVGMAA